MDACCPKRLTGVVLSVLEVPDFMNFNLPCRNCGCCPHCGQAMLIAGPYTPVHYYMYPPQRIYPLTVPIPILPYDIYVGDPMPGWGSTTISFNAHPTI